PAAREDKKDYNLPEETLSQNKEESTKPVIISNEILPDNSFSDELTKAADLIGSKDYDEAEEIFNNIHQLAPKHVKALLAHANMCFMLKRNNEAARLYKDALEINPNIVKALFNLGTIYFVARKYETSLQYLVKALSIYPKILGAYLLLAQIYQIAGKYNDSVKLLSRAVELSPRNPVIYQKLATLHMQLRQFDEATIVLEKAIEISPASTEASVLLAYCYNYIGQPQRAFDALNLTLKTCSQAPNQENAIRQMLKGYVFTQTALNAYSPNN
ncbi:MAG: tetratricopeptide repeat protein, partial [Candidatus Riflebacteria bacterium]|nr:tetratricopeptide repeat protein [Candidatus Riflebacteria bacterium]